MHAPDVERRLATIFSADVVGLAAGAELEANRAQLLDRKIAEHKGRIFGRRGAAVTAEFASVVDAVRCAVEVQREFGTRNAVASVEERVVCRVGVNLGDVVDAADGPEGGGVDFAARLKDLAEPGGVRVSAVAHDRVTSVIGLDGARRDDRGRKHRIAWLIQWSALLAYFLGWWALIFWKTIYYAVHSTWPCWPVWMCN